MCMNRLFYELSEKNELLRNFYSFGGKWIRFESDIVASTASRFVVIVVNVSNEQTGLASNSVMGRLSE